MAKRSKTVTEANLERAEAELASIDSAFEMETREAEPNQVALVEMEKDRAIVAAEVARLTVEVAKRGKANARARARSSALRAQGLVKTPDGWA